MPSERTKRVNADCCGLHVDPVCGDGRVADAWQVRRDHCKFLGEQRQYRGPHPRSLGEAVQQNYRWAVSTDGVVQLQAIDVGILRSES